MLVATTSLGAQLVTGGWSLFETAMTGDISAAAGATKRFQTDTAKRFIETLRMFVMMYSPSVFDRESEEFQTVVRVRLIHCLASRGLKRAWGEENYLRYGEPIASVSTLGFGNGPLLVRLIDNALGRKLSKQDLDDIAMYASWVSRLIGAPEPLLTTDGIELVKSLNYIIARGGDPSKYRPDFLNVAGVFSRMIIDSVIGGLPAPVRNIAYEMSLRVLAYTFVVPIVMVFGEDEASASIADTVVEPLGINYRISGAVFERLARLNSLAVGAFERVPGVKQLEGLLLGGGQAASVVVDAMDKFGKKYYGLKLDYTHHDASTSGMAFASR
ncbi:oxygenase MpaB family protein [Mycobacteroides saopaulense]|uniref:oxygenase MpaB family protein n=1 Tax=Mycobacteroides saopaulense TaxID=1578165 RepID=UPI001F422986|nr:oxygenase MpaB family protein [Mycobacteroides saopaulense]